MPTGELGSASPGRPPTIPTSSIARRWAHRQELSCIHLPQRLDPVRAAIHLQHYSIRTEAAYGQWIMRFVLFHREREFDGDKIQSQLSTLGVLDYRMSFANYITHNYQVIINMLPEIRLG